MAPRRTKKAKATVEPGGYLVRFVPGGYYHLKGGALFTGVRRQEAGQTIVEKLLPLAKKSARTPGEWVTL
jgi:hypothetical protein